MKNYLLILCDKYTDIPNHRKQILDDGRFLYNYFIADPHIENDYKMENDIIYIKLDDKLENISMLFYKALSYVYNSIKNINGIFRLDYDLEINLDNLYKIINNTNYLYLGEVYYNTIQYSKYYEKNFNNKKLLLPECIYCSNIGYYISVELIQILLSNKKIFDNIIYEDICVGIILNRNNIYPHYVNIIGEICKEKEQIKQQTIEQTTRLNTTTYSNVCKYCGYPKDTVRFNYCPRCQKIY